MEDVALNNLQVYHFAVNGVVDTPLRLPHDQPGKALRGAFCQAMLYRFCQNKQAFSCAECWLNQGCPVSSLVAPLRDENKGGRDAPRPYSIRSPKARDWYRPGEYLTFGITLLGKMLPLLPYVVMSAHNMSQFGLGTPEPTTGRRGRFTIVAVESVNLLNGSCQKLLNQQKQVDFPTLAITQAHVKARVAQLNPTGLEIELTSPLRLVDNGQLVRRFSFRPLFQRLVERLSALQKEYGDNSACLIDYPRLLSQAAQVRVVEDKTAWQDIPSYSSRQQRNTPIGGLVGKARIEGDLSSLLPYLVWGEVLQVGKDVVKGNGCYLLSNA
jgi:hypothetical protein